ncbi:sensor histidine kinase [Agromyces archimandritae]|uniref:histidine kinase n=1 Tax=Agromyces archimandritae TaxID=2781962 RepID=A0A975IMP3_9MICO|nr:HAMP domain-containing sensor histidine kinase [Agromyces archimandritae]QTX03728.1 HAMP domain-containing histidine kinase [Agromyces archimandritae]
MTKPGEPGHAAAARAAREAAVREGDAAAVDAGSRAPWTLRRRLLVLIAALLIAVSAAIGVVGVLLFHASSVGRLDASLGAASDRATAVAPSGAPADPLQTVRQFLGVPGQPNGTLAGLRYDGRTVAAVIDNGVIVDLGTESRAALAALADVAADRRPHTITARGYGEYRALAVQTDPGVTVILALPLADVAAQTRQLAVTVAVVALGGVVVALVAGSLIVRRALEPLERVTATAQAVSELPLDRGDVDLDERVPTGDPRTEVGRLGTAFNRMLGHVSTALNARERSERQVRRFVADASHELRTPLASIRGYSELMRLHGGELPEDVRRALGRIESESVRMTTLVEELLLLARLDEGRELERRPVDLGALVADAVGDAQVSGPDHDWSLEAPEEGVHVSGDDGRLRQLVANLLANARLHTPEGTRVRVSVTADAGEARLVVADDGPGIPAELRDTLFERFARGDSSRSRRAGSTGLGLSIVRAVAEGHGGRVEVDSEPGSTVFTVVLPLGEAGDGRDAGDAPAGA